MTDRFAIPALVLDDEPFMLQLLGRMLANLGYSRVHEHDNGPSALQALDEVSGMPGLILLDINMPGMDGLEFVRHLAERNYPGSLILVSGEDQLMLQATERLARAFDLTVLGSLHKPPMPAKLTALVQRWAPPADANLRSPIKIYDARAIGAGIANDEFVNYYQPKVAVSTGEFIGVEALARWQHPEDGLVLPAQFIPVAEAHGLIGELTRSVTRRALAQIKAWQDTGLCLRLAINVSMDDLSQLDFADFVAAAAHAAGVSPQHVVLEVTESRLLHKITTVLEVMTRLRLKRFHLSIDDFGTGHSTLLQLCALPLDELKIDRSFTHKAWQDSRLRAIFEASLGLAKQIGMEVVAEGAVNVEDWTFLRATGCEVAQGYFISHPIPAAEIPTWLGKWQTRVVQERLAED